jgi:hypothetical protein
MQDHSHSPVASVHGLRPETWAVAKYDALREALSVLMADIIYERRRNETACVAALAEENFAEVERLSLLVNSLIQLEQAGHRARTEHETEALRLNLEVLQQEFGVLVRLEQGALEGSATSRVA